MHLNAPCPLLKTPEKTTYGKIWRILAKKDTEGSWILKYWTIKSTNKNTMLSE